MTTQISADNIQQATLESIGGGPTVTNVQITDSSYNVLDDTAVSTSGGYLKITGTNFASGCEVVIGSVNATSVTFVNSTTLNVQVPAATAGTYVVYVVNTDGGVAIRVNGLTYSGVPTWVTGSTLTPGVVDTAISIQLNATDATTYQLQAGSSLPSGLTLTSGGLLSGTITGLTSETTYNFTIEAIDSELQDSPRAFSITITVGDEYWSYVTTLLSPTLSTLPFNSDASTNNFDITVSGDTKPNSFNPYTPGYYSVYFDGTGDYLSIASNPALELGSGNYTIEGWWYFTDTSNQAMVSKYTGSGGYVVQYQANNLRMVFNTGAPGADVVYSFSWTPVANVWYHVAITRSGTSGRAFINGVQIGTTTTFTTSNASTSTPLQIGSTQTVSELTRGYVSDLRIVKGTAVYTANFTPPTAPLTAISGTSLLTCQSNRFIDASTNNFAITRAGDTRISGFSPYTPNSSYSGYGSTYFDGTGDQLTLAANAALQLTGDFTVEAWVYPTVINSFNMIFGVENSANSDYLAIRASSLEIALSNSVYPGWSHTFVANQWYHIVVTRSSNTLRAFVNGVQLTLASGTSTSSLQYFQSGVPFVIGKYATAPTAPHFFTGYISNARIVKGTALYTEAFTPPTAPLTAVTNTSLLTLQNNQPVNNNVFIDNSTNNLLVTRAGNTTQGTFSPYGENWSCYFDGNGDYLTLTSLNTVFNPNNNFTLEFWFNTANLSTGANTWIFGSPNGSGFHVVLESGKISIRQWGLFVIASSANIAVNTWTHVAITRSSNNWYMYFNGTSVLSATQASSFDTTSATYYMGGRPSAEYVTGYISNFRIVQTTVLYPNGTSFTPSTTPLQPIANTILLTCKDPNIVDDSVNNFTFTRTGDVSVQKFGPFAGTTLPTPYYSAYFDGNNDYLTTPSNAAFTLGTGDFTIECWFNRTGANSGSSTLFDFRTAEPSIAPNLYVHGSGGATPLQLEYYVNGAARIITTSAPDANTWYHVAVVRSSGVTKMYLNGTQVGSSYTDSNDYVGTITTVGGRFAAISGDFRSWFGYISNARIVKGTAVYTSNFTPPASPLTAIANTSLLTCQSNTFVDNSTNNFAITVNGNTRPTTFNPFTVSYSTNQGYTPSVFGGSMYFDGTGDSLLVTTNTLLAMGSGIFTIELWHYALPRVSSDPAMLSNWTSTWGANFWTLHDRHSAYNTKYTFWVNNFNASAPLLTSTATVKEYQWTHLVITRSGSTWRMYVNGALDTTATSAVALDAGTTYPISVGVTSGSSSLSGYLSSIRFIKNQQLYTTAFVPSSAPLTAVQNSVLLLNGTGAGVTDSSMIANYETVGGAIVTTSTKYYGSNSVFFNGTNSGLFSASSVQHSFGSGNFTIEFWYYPTSTAGTNPNIMCNWSGSGSFVSGQWSLHAPHANYANKYSLWVGSFNTGAALLVSTSNIATNTWTFVTITRTTNTWRLFINGTIEATATHSGVFDNGGSYPQYIGYQPSADSGRYITGYMCDIRLTNGVSRYAANFTPPTTPFIQY